MASVEDMVLAYLKENPGSNPRKIADALGLSLTKVRVALLRLRDRGQVVRTSRGYVAVAQPRDLEAYQVRGPPVSQAGIKAAEASSRLDALEKRMSVLEARLDALEERLGMVADELEKLREALRRRGGEDPGLRRTRPRVRELRELLEERKVIPLDEARRHAISRSLKDYLDSGEAVVLGGLVVEKRFYDEFRSRFPIPVGEVSRLTREEKMLLEAMVSEGLAYLHAGREYRLI